MKHAVLAPSSAARRVACSASRSMEEQYPREDSESSLEGDLAHAVAVNLFDRLPTTRLTKDPEMLAMCEKYVDYVIGVAGDERMYIEAKIDISTIHKDCWGTADAHFIKDDTLHVFDFKYGFVPVEVYLNWQLLEYAAGILDMGMIVKNSHTSMYESRKDPRIKNVTLHIVQPRAYHQDGPFRTWSIPVAQLDPYFTILRLAEAKSMDPAAWTFTPSDMCTYCTARHACPGLRKKVYHEAQAFDYNPPQELNNEELGQELFMLQRAKKFLDVYVHSLETEALFKLKDAQRIPFFELTSVAGREVWDVPIDEVIKLGGLFETTVKKDVPAPLITPKQAVKAGIPKSVVDRYTRINKGKLKIQQISSNKMKSIFKKVLTEPSKDDIISNSTND